MARQSVGSIGKNLGFEGQTEQPSTGGAAAARYPADDKRLYGGRGYHERADWWAPRLFQAPVRLPDYHGMEPSSAPD
jgi:outer membrane receptor protein involved in Fe transport